MNRKKNEPLYKKLTQLNSNNFSGRDLNEISDWEDFNFEDDDVISELDNIIKVNENQIETGDPEYMENKEFKEIDSDNFEVVLSDDEENAIKHVNLSKSSKRNKCEIIPSPCLICSNKNMLKCLLRQMINNIWKVLEYLWKIFSTMYFCILQILGFPFIITRKIMRKSKEFTRSSTIFMVPFKLIPLIIEKTFQMITTRHSCRKKQITRSKHKSTKNVNFLSEMNSNNNNLSEDSYEEEKRFSLCWYIFCIVILIGGLFIHCWFTTDSQTCSMNSIIRIAKMKFLYIYNEIYMLPGQHCMKANRCCKGFMEATLRWLNCFLTLPVRSSLTAWPRKPQEKDLSDRTYDIKSLVEKIIFEVSQARQRTNKQEESILILRDKLSNLEKIIDEASKDLSVLEPSLISISKLVQQINVNITQGLNQIKNIIIKKHDADKIIEAIKIISRDSSNSVKLLISKLHKEIDAEYHRLNSRIKSLETIVKDKKSEVTESAMQALHTLKTELDLLKLNQDELGLKFDRLNDIPDIYHKIFEQLKSDVKVKLAEHLAYHEQLSKKTESHCIELLNKFKENMEKTKLDLNCFVESSLNKEICEIKNQLQTEISDNLYENTLEIVKTMVEETLSDQEKDKTIKRPYIKSAGFLTELKTIGSKTIICNLFNVEKFSNFSAYCLNNESSKENLNKNENCVSNEKIKKIVKIAISKYSADKIGLADFALESMGGSVIASRSSSTYNGHRGIFSFFSIPPLRPSNSLRTIIQSGNQPGDCWPFPGTAGHATVRLSYRILINAITLEHLPASLNPGGKILSAPKQFRIFGVSESYDKQEFIGEFEYKNNSKSIQTFPVKIPIVTQIILLDVLNNHGNEDYTCIYRLRVHGRLSN